MTTGAVSTGDVTEQVRAGGTIGFADSRPVGSGLAGTITGLPAPGTIVDRGGELFRIDDRPVLLMFGPIPAWRDFAPGMTDGRDVRQLEENLRALGFFAAEPDDTFTSRTAAAVRAWQKSVGLEKTGEVPLGGVVFEAGPVRIASADAKVGASSSSDIVTVTHTDKQITIDLDADLASAAKVDTQARVSLPDGSTIDAVVVSVGATVQKSGENGEKTLIVPLVLRPADPAAGGDLVDVSVSATFTRTLASDVLRVPVVALLAGPDGTTQVEVVEKKTTRLVTITPGAFGDGLVEVAKGALKAGQKVVIAP